MFYLKPPCHISTLQNCEKLTVSKCFPICPPSDMRHRSREVSSVPNAGIALSRAELSRSDRRSCSGRVL